MNPTTNVFEQRITAIEGGTAAPGDASDSAASSPGINGKFPELAPIITVEKIEDLHYLLDLGLAYV
jgi:hypothetical protein